MLCVDLIWIKSNILDRKEERQRNKKDNFKLNFIQDDSKKIFLAKFSKSYAFGDFCSVDLLVSLISSMSKLGYSCLSPDLSLSIFQRFLALITFAFCSSSLCFGVCGACVYVLPCLFSLSHWQVMPSWGLRLWCQIKPILNYIFSISFSKFNLACPIRDILHGMWTYTYFMLLSIEQNMRQYCGLVTLLSVFCHMWLVF
jgi:hypothetical protein